MIESKGQWLPAAPDILVFFREIDGAGHFYWIEAPSTREEARKHAELNPGTLRVEDAYGVILWEPTPAEPDRG